MTAVPPRPAAPDATAGNRLRDAIAQRLWDACKGEGSHLSWDDGRVSDRYKNRYRTYADAVLALPELRDVLAAAARDAEKLRLQIELARIVTAAYEWHIEVQRRNHYGDTIEQRTPMVVVAASRDEVTSKVRAAFGATYDDFRNFWSHGWSLREVREVSP